MEVRAELLHGDRLVNCFAGRGRTLVRLMQAAVEAAPDAPAVVQGDVEWTWRELDRRASRLANALHARGVRPGARVALFMGNRPEYLALLHATWRLGAIAVPIGVRQSRLELRNLLQHSGAVVLAFDAALRERLPAHAEAGQVTAWVSVAGRAQAGEADFEALLQEGSEAARAEKVEEQSAACLMYTSGTTGQPKGALLSHLGFWHTAENYRRRMGYTERDRFLLTIPGTHISGLVAVIAACLRAAGCVVMLDEFQAARALDEIARRRITAAVMVPAMFNLLLLQDDFGSRDLSAWRVGHYGGAPMPAVTIEQLARRLPGLALFNGYGATETTSAVTLDLPGDAGDADARLGVGVVLPCMEVRVMGPDGAEVPPGEVGELWIRGPGNAIAYWNAPEATRAAFVAGYWRSGDVARVDPQGRVFLLDRMKDVINRGGFKVYATELEAHLLRLDGVVEAAAVASPCPVLGERIHLFLQARRAITLDEARAHCRDALADYKLPDRLTTGTEPLPRNLNGKLSKPELRARAAQLAAAEVR